MVREIRKSLPYQSASCTQRQTYPPVTTKTKIHKIVQDLILTNKNDNKSYYEFLRFWYHVYNLGYKFYIYIKMQVNNK